MEHFDPSGLASGARFRDEMRYKAGFSEAPTHRLDTAHDVLATALEKHGETSITRDNYEKVMEHARRDPRWEHLHSGGTALETHIKAHLGIKDESTPE
jgi:hypothetical protein